MRDAADTDGFGWGTDCARKGREASSPRQSSRSLSHLKTTMWGEGTSYSCMESARTCWLKKVTTPIGFSSSAAVAFCASRSKKVMSPRCPRLPCCKEKALRAARAVGWKGRITERRVLHHNECRKISRSIMWVGAGEWKGQSRKGKTQMNEKRPADSLSVLYDESHASPAPENEMTNNRGRTT